MPVEQQNVTRRCACNTGRLLVPQASDGIRIRNLQPSPWRSREVLCPRMGQPCGILGAQIPTDCANLLISSRKPREWLGD